MSNHPLVIVALGLVITLGLTMVVGLVVPPWGDPNRGPYTKLNLLEQVPAGYERTSVALVGNQGYLGPSWQPSGNLSSEEGYAAYVAHGCASCHGLNAQGGVVAGSPAGLGEEFVQSFVRAGPGGMPAYSEEELPDEHLAAISSWLSALEEPGGAPQVPHTLEGRSDCLLCHALGGLRPFPEDHEGRTNDMCLECHQTLE